MRMLVAIVASTPLALAVACSQDQAQDEAVAAPETELVDTSAGPDSTAVALSDADLSGDYLAEADGGQSRLSLNSGDMSYTYYDPQGQETSGTYSVVDDYRIKIADLDGIEHYYSWDGANLRQLADADTDPNDTINVTAQYKRDNLAVGQTGGPGATTATINDKRQ